MSVCQHETLSSNSQARIPSVLASGHRISTGRLEEVANDHEAIVESAVIGYNDEVRGECPLAFVILKG